MSIDTESTDQSRGEADQYKSISIPIFRARVRDNFSSNYLTLISIVQGVALSVWVSKLGLPIVSFADFEVAGLLAKGLSFFTIVLIVYYYSWFVSVVYTPPNFRETFVPLALAASQIINMYYFDNIQLWWLSAAVFFGFATLAFVNTLVTVNDNDYEPEMSEVVRLLKSEMYMNIVITFLAIAVCLFAYSVSLDESIKIDSICIILIGALSVIGVLKTEMHTLKKMYQVTGLR